MRFPQVPCIPSHASRGAQRRESFLPFLPRGRRMQGARGGPRRGRPGLPPVILACSAEPDGYRRSLRRPDSIGASACLGGALPDFGYAHRVRPGSRIGRLRMPTGSRLSRLHKGDRANGERQQEGP